MKIKKNIAILIGLLFMFACRLPESTGFYNPVTLDLKVPDGPAEYKAGWYAGCKSFLANRGLGQFNNAFVYGEGHGATFGSGVYQHDPVYQQGWGQAWFACGMHIQNFAGYGAMRDGPLE